MAPLTNPNAQRQRSERALTLRGDTPHRNPGDAARARAVRAQLAPVSIAALNRMECPRCGPQTLHNGNKCVVCGHAPAKKRGRRPEGAAPPWAIKRRPHITAANRPTAKRGN